MSSFVCRVGKTQSDTTCLSTNVLWKWPGMTRSLAREVTGHWTQTATICLIMDPFSEDGRGSRRKIPYGETVGGWVTLSVALSWEAVVSVDMSHIVHIRVVYCSWFLIVNTVSQFWQKENKSELIFSINVEKSQGQYTGGQSSYFIPTKDNICFIWLVVAWYAFLWLAVAD